MYTFADNVQTLQTMQSRSFRGGCEQTSTRDEVIAEPEETCLLRLMKHTGTELPRGLRRVFASCFESFWCGFCFESVAMKRPF